MLKLILQGIVVGVANIIPGVSGGTMMVAMGVYDKLIHSITHLRKEFLKSLKFLLPILIGAALAVIILSRLFEFLLANHPIPTNLAFCGLIMGCLPCIFEKVKGHRVTVGKLIPFIIFFVIVVSMAIFGAAGGASADISLNFINIIKLFGVGIIAAATMVIPGVSGSMILMLLGYYDTILAVINNFVDAVVHFDMPMIFETVGILLPFGIGVIVGIFAIAKIIEIIFAKAEVHAYYAILGLIIASPIAILIQTDWSTFSVPALLIGIVTFIAGWFVASKLGRE